MDESFTTPGLTKSPGVCVVSGPVRADNSVLITNNTSLFRLPAWESDQIGSQDAVWMKELNLISVAKATQSEHL